MPSALSRSTGKTPSVPSIYVASPQPPSPSLLVRGSPVHCPRHAFCTIPRLEQLLLEEARLSNALVVLVVGTRPPVSLEQVRSLLVHSYGVEATEFTMHRVCLEDFIVVFNDPVSREHVLRSPFPVESLF